MRTHNKWTWPETYVREFIIGPQDTLAIFTPAQAFARNARDWPDHRRRPAIGSAERSEWIVMGMTDIMKRMGL